MVKFAWCDPAFEATQHDRCPVTIPSGYRCECPNHEKEEQ